MKKRRLDLKLNETQRKSSAKLCHDTAKALVVAAIVDGFFKDNFSRPLGTLSIAILCFAAGLSIEQTLKERGDNNDK